jgi:hypothetical protein
MPPLVRVGLAASLLATLAVMTDRPPRAIRVGAASRPGPSATALSALCPRGTLPDGDVCVPVPPREPERGGEPTARPRSGHDRIERRPDRPADYARYRLPFDPAPGTSTEGPRFATARGTAVRGVRFEHQEGDAEVLHAGPLDGASGKAIVLLHAVRDAAGLRDYLSIFANLARVEPAVTRGARVRDGEVLGSPNDAAASLSPAVDWEVRRLRAGVAARSLEPADFVADARTVACDARNVLLPR